MTPRGERGNGSPPPVTLLALTGGTNSSSAPISLPYEGMKQDSYLLLTAVAYPTGGNPFPVPLHSRSPLLETNVMHVTHSHSAITPHPARFRRLCGTYRPRRFRLCSLYRVLLGGKCGAVRGANIRVGPRRNPPTFYPLPGK